MYSRENSDSTKPDGTKIDMLNGGLFRKLIVFAIPLIASGMLQQSFNSVDVAVVGRWSTSQALAAVGSNGMVISLIVNLFLGISVGANVVIAHYIGRKDEQGVRNAVNTVTVLAIASGLILAVLGFSISRPILEAMSTPDDVIDLATTYLQIYFIGMPFLMIYNFSSAVLRSVGDTKRPFYCLIAGGIVNVVLNLILVIVFDMSVAGVAIATVISNVVSSALMVRILMRETGPIKLNVSHMKLSTVETMKMLKIGMPAGLQGMVFSFSNVFVMSAINSFGWAASAGSAAAINFEYYCYFVVNSFAMASVAFTSQNYGAGKTERCNKIFRQCLACSVVGCAFLNLTIASFKPFFISWFTADPAVYEYAALRIDHALAFQFIASTYEIAGATMRGLGYSMTPTLLTILGTCVLRLGWIYIFLHYSIGGFGTLLNIYPFTWIVTGALVMTAYFIVRKKAYGKYLIQ